MAAMLIVAARARLLSDHARPRRDHGAVITDPPALLDRFAALPAAAPLLGRLDGWAEDVFLVGGAVRDLMLGLEPTDLDLLVTEPVSALAARLGAAITIHDRFGTAGGDLDGHRYDVARARSETYAHPGALPEVSRSGVLEDLARRDFTVNAIALGILGPQRGALMSAGPAIDDLRARQLRVLHDHSFIDDPTRLLRLSRYRARLGFAIEAHTHELARDAVATEALTTVSGSRLGAELRLLAAEPDPVAAFLGLSELGLDAAIARGFGLHEPGVVQRALSLLPEDGRPAVLVLGAALEDLHRAAQVSLLNRLAFPAQSRDRILDAAGGRGLARRLRQADRASEIAVSIGSAGPEAVALAGAYGAQAAARRWLDELRHVRLEITGADLISAGVAPGPALGRGLAAALGARLDGHAPDAPTQLRIALRTAEQGGD
jgi:tRNA nucleotidyltransferase (CCA-adding enzyme)